MRSPRISPRIWVIGAAAVLAGLAPYLLASRLAPAGAVFTGFLINPVDGFSYLAKMRQAAEGPLLFQLPYAPEPGPGALLFVFYLVLGRVAHWIRGDLLAVFHTARLLSGAVMLGAGYMFLGRVLDERKQLHWGFAVFALGSGLGWLFGPLGLITTDLTVPESIPFYSLLVNPHFPLSTALLACVGILLLAPRRRTAVHGLIAFALGSALALVQPFAVLTPLAFGAVWLVWEGLRMSTNSWRVALQELRPQIQRLVFFGLGAAPWLLYDLYVVRVHPALAAWNMQNQTPSPPVWSFLLGTGVVGGLAIYAGLQAETRSTRTGRFLITWAVVNFALLYAPFNLQRRLALGMFLPLSALAAFGLGTIVRTRPRGKLLAIALVLLALPSNLFVIAAGLAQVASGDPALLFAQGERDAYAWIDENLAEDTLLLAGPRTGNRLPAFADVRVLYGHPFETPNAAEQRRRVEMLFRSGTLADLRSSEVNHVVYGPREKELGQPDWLGRLELKFEAGEFDVLRVP